MNTFSLQMRLNYRRQNYCAVILHKTTRTFLSRWTWYTSASPRDVFRLVPGERHFVKHHRSYLLLQTKTREGLDTEYVLTFTDPLRKYLVVWLQEAVEGTEIQRYGGTPGGKVWRKVPILLFQGKKNFGKGSRLYNGIK